MAFFIYLKYLSKYIEQSIDMINRTVYYSIHAVTKHGMKAIEWQMLKQANPTPAVFQDLCSNSVTA